MQTSSSSMIAQQTTRRKSHGDAGAIVVSIPCNLGIGGAVQTGFKFAREYDYDVVVRLDGDGQHDPKEIPALVCRTYVRARRTRSLAHVLSGKESDMKIPLGRRLGIKTFAFLGNDVNRTASHRYDLRLYVFEPLCDWRAGRLLAPGLS